MERGAAVHDRGIGELLANNPSPGRVALSFERAPSYLASTRTLGPVVQHRVIRHVPSGRIVALGSRAIRPRWVNGEVEPVGYLTDLVVDREFRGRWLVARLFQELRAEHRDGLTAGYITIIADENDTSRGVLVTRPRTHFPSYRPVTRLWSLALPLWSGGAPRRSDPRVACASREDLPSIVAFLRQSGSAKQFFPAYAEAEFAPGSPLTAGFAVEDFLVLREGSQVVGVVGLWDRSASKQTVVRSYDWPYRLARPWFSAVAALVGAPPLPRPGERLPLVYASFVCVADNDPTLFRILLAHLYRLALERRHGYLVVDLAERDPLLAVAREFRHFSTGRTLYAVSYPEDPDLSARLDGRIPYVDTASL